MKVLRSRYARWSCASSRKRSRRIAAARSVPASDRKRSGHNFRRTASPIIRINFTTHRLTEVLNGDLPELLDQVTTHYQSEKLKDATAVS
jgi:protein subunit release factor A